MSQQIFQRERAHPTFALEIFALMELTEALPTSSTPQACPIKHFTLVV